jgi:hypothetical protein
MQHTTKPKSSAQERAEGGRSPRREFERRLDPAAWSCRREGHPWVAEGPAGNRFEFRPAPNGEDVEVTSASGGRYELCADDDGHRHCNCPAALKNPGVPCKHLVAWKAVRTAGRMAKELGEVRG